MTRGGTPEKQGEKQGVFDPERLKWFRNVSFLGAAALAGAGVVVPSSGNLLFTGAAVNTAQGVGAEAFRQHQQNRGNRTAPA
jgi:hypothetical protein